MCFWRYIFQKKHSNIKEEYNSVLYILNNVQMNEWGLWNVFFCNII